MERFEKLLNSLRTINPILAIRIQNQFAQANLKSGPKAAQNTVNL
jgi:hypothetical protein